jgi:uncharacterized protein
MSRLLFWIALIVLIVAAIRSKLRTFASSQQDSSSGGSPLPRTGDAEAMARCDHCGLHFPASESVRADGRDYCSPAHVRLPPK